MKIKIKLHEVNVTQKLGLKSSGRSGSPEFIVIHHAVCPTSDCTFNTLKERGLSTHYEVEKNGLIIQYVDPGAVAWHAGQGFNGRSIGIDLTGKGENATEEQKSALQALVTSLCQRFSIPQVVAPDGLKYKNDNEIIEAGVGIVRHRNVKSTECPGGFPMGILGEMSDEPIEISFTSSDEKEKEELGDEISSGSDNKKHKKEMKVAGGRFLSKYKYFLEEHPDFDFDEFYSDLDSYVEGGVDRALPEYGKDYVFGPEHMHGWNILERSISNQADLVSEIVNFGGLLPGLVGDFGVSSGDTIVPHKATKNKLPDEDSYITVKACLHRNSMVLLLKNEKGWDLPGGHLKQGESPVDGLRREIFEETGLNIEDIDMVNGPTGKRRFYCASFLTDDVHLSNEHHEYKFFHIDEIKNLDNLNETFRSVILKCLGDEPTKKKNKISRIKIGIKI